MEENIMNNIYVNENEKYVRLNVKKEYRDKEGNTGYFLNLNEIKYESAYKASFLAFAYAEKVQNALHEEILTIENLNDYLNNNPLIIKPQQLQKLGIDTKRNKNLVEELRNLKSLSVITATGTNEIAFTNLFKRSYYETGVGLKLYFNDLFLLDYRKLETNFVNFPLKEIKLLGNRGRIQFYQFLRSHLNSHDMKHTQGILINENNLRKLLDCEDKYEDQKNFNRVVRKAIEKINNGTDIFVLDFFKHRGEDKYFLKVCWSQNGRESIYMDQVFGAGNIINEEDSQVYYGDIFDSNELPF